MSIKNPWPNIKDNEVNDNTTWSSAKIKAEIDAILAVIPTDEDDGEG